MAFFKIRWPQQQAAATKPAKAARAVRGETVEVMRRRARHRLMGAALLVLVGVVGFPLLFDTQPRPIPVDTRIEIPDRDKVAPLVVPATPVAAPAVGVEPSAREPEASAKAGTAAVERPPAAAPAHKDAAAPAFVESKPQAGANKSEPKTEPPPVVVHQPAVQAPLGEAERARALLEGRAGKAAAVNPAAPPAAAAAGAERLIVQVGAFSDETKVREARQKLERAGITTYTQVVQTPGGKRTRVRVGPFQGRDLAEKAAVKIRALGLPAAVLTL